MKIKILKFIKFFLNKYLPKEHHLKDTFLHSLLGENLFNPKLWAPTKKSVTLAALVGTFIAFTPTIGLQMILAGIFAFLLRINIPVTLLFVWISNPFTAPFIYPFEYEIGKHILGITNGPKIHGIKSLFTNFFAIAKPLGLGSLIVSIIAALIVYSIVLIFWKFIKRLHPRNTQ